MTEFPRAWKVLYAGVESSRITGGFEARTCLSARFGRGASKSIMDADFFRLTTGRAFYFLRDRQGDAIF